MVQVIGFGGSGFFAMPTVSAGRGRSVVLVGAETTARWRSLLSYADIWVG
jgi:hypothetical protein